MKKANTLNKVMMLVCLGTLMLFLISIAIRFFTRQVLILHMGIENKFTSVVFFDDADMATAEDLSVTTYGETDDYSIDWAGQYPFEDVVEISNEVLEEDTSVLGCYKSLINSLEGRIEHYAQDNLVGYSYFTEWANRCEKLIGWNFTSYNEYNGIFQLSDGYWTSLKPETNMSGHIESLKNLNEECKAIDAELVYIQAPFKISKYEDTDISGQLDFSNQNADRLLEGLQSYGIPTLDLRELILQSGKGQHELFYRTDHHWKADTGLWAAGAISEFLNEKYDLGIDTSLLNTSNFISKNYEDWFLGSYGKKVTLGKAQPEDFSLLYPNYTTQLHYEIPSIGIDTTGDFSVMYNMEAVEPRDYYNKSPYAAYNYGDRAIIRIDNEMIDSGGKILMVHDSFADSVIPFMALGMNNIESIDLRYFNGSLEKYLEQSKPNIVLVMYNAGEISDEIDYTTHTDIFDFR